MTNRLLIKNSCLLSTTDKINLYVTEDLITFRYLRSTDEENNSDVNILSHDLVYKGYHAPYAGEVAIISYNDKNYSIIYECSLDKKVVNSTWKAGQVCLICAPASYLLNSRVPDIFKVDLYSNTYTTKSSLGAFSNELRAFTGMGAFLRYFPLRNQNFLTSNCALICHNPENLITNLEFTETLDKGDSENINLFYNKVNTQVNIKAPSEIQANGEETLEVEVLYDGEYLQEPLTLKVECVDGYASHTRLNIVNGKGSVKVNALGLKAGEQMRIKLNDDFFTSKAEHIFKVI